MAEDCGGIGRQVEGGSLLQAHGIRFGLAAGLLGLAVLVLVTTPWGAQLWALLLDPRVEHAQRILTASADWLPLVIIGLMILHTLIPVPAEVLALAAGIALGPFWGVVTIWLGAMLGAYLGFFLARTFGPPLLRRLVATQRLERMQRWLHQVDVPLLLTVRLLPVLSFNMVNFALGFTHISWWQFTWTTGVGIVPVTVIVVLFGAYLHDWRLLALMTLAALLVGVGGYVILRWRYGVFLPRRASYHPGEHEDHRSR